MQDPLLAKTNTDTYLGFDFGNKKIGTAVGQTITATASPLQTIRSINQNPNWDIIGKLIQEWRPTGLVVGISKQADGSVVIPEALRPYMGGLERITRQG